MVTNTSGAVLNDRLSHDPFGARRQHTWASDISIAQLNTILANEDERFYRGFTDHEHLNRTGFVHMNGRVYDPRIGRFVSPDPIVQAPWMSQSYNRYAYVFNNPMSLVDPSGFASGELDGPPPGPPNPLPPSGSPHIMGHPLSGNLAFCFSAAVGCVTNPNATEGHYDALRTLAYLSGSIADPPRDVAGRPPFGESFAGLPLLGAWSALGLVVQMEFLKRSRTQAYHKIS